MNTVSFLRCSAIMAATALPFQTQAQNVDKNPASSFNALLSGNKNTIEANTSYTVISGGEGNKGIGVYAATIGGGSGNTVSGNQATVGGGYQNSAQSQATVGGGYQNSAINTCATVGGGIYNTASGYNSIIGGGSGNAASGTNTTISGGGANAASGLYSTISGGIYNSASGTNTTISGGIYNSASGASAAIPGGSNNVAGNGAFAAGIRSKATNDGSFVWSGVTTVDTSSTNARSFTVRAPGGARFITATNNTLTGVRLLPNATSWTILSDRESKSDFQKINPRAVLAKLVAMPVTSWKYKHDPSRRYIGPTSQDFMAAFHLGDYDKGINTLDADGVTFAAIQGLVEEIKERDKAMAARDQTIEELKTELRALREQVQNALPPAP